MLIVIEIEPVLVAAEEESAPARLQPNLKKGYSRLAVAAGEVKKLNRVLRFYSEQRPHDDFGVNWGDDCSRRVRIESTSAAGATIPAAREAAINSSKRP